MGSGTSVQSALAAALPFCIERASRTVREVDWVESYSIRDVSGDAVVITTNVFGIVR